MSEISGIIRNGVERNWPIEEIKNSLLNSGYPEQEIDSELNLFSSRKNTSPIINIAQPINVNSQNLTNYQAPGVEKKASNKMVMAIIILLILCIAAGVGFFIYTLLK